jgi:hypothetical protein
VPWIEEQFAEEERQALKGALLQAIAQTGTPDRAQHGPRCQAPASLAGCAVSSIGPGNRLPSLRHNSLCPYRGR